MENLNDLADQFQSLKNKAELEKAFYNGYISCISQVLDIINDLIFKSENYKEILEPPEQNTEEMESPLIVDP